MYTEKGHIENNVEIPPQSCHCIYRVDKLDHNYSTKKKRKKIAK